MQHEIAIEPGRASPRARNRPRIAVAPLVLAAILCASPLLFQVDAPVCDWVQSWTHDGTFIREVMKFCYLFFTWWAFIVAAIALLLIGRDWRPLLASALTVAVWSGLLHLTKFVVGRARPQNNLGAMHFDAFGDPDQKLDSFPSGHASMAFMLALLLNRYFPGSGWFFLPAAVLASLARIAQDRHYPSDVVAGAALAGLCVQLGMIVFGRRWFSPPGTTPPSAPA